MRPLLFTQLRRLLSPDSVDKKYNPNQPRHPKGRGRESGRWSDSGSSGLRDDTTSDGGRKAPRASRLHGDAVATEETRRHVDERAQDAWRSGGAEALVRELESRTDQAAQHEALKIMLDTPHPVHGKTMNEMVAIESEFREAGGYESPITLAQQEEINQLVLEKIEEGAEERVRGRRAAIIIGLPGSGKSSVINAFQKDLKGMEIDADHFKKRLKGFEGGLGAFEVHERSSRAASDTIEIAVSRGENLILPKIGSAKNERSIRKLINKLKDSGYTVEVHAVQLDHTETMKRVTSRFLGRPEKPGTQLVPIGYVRSLKGYESVRLMETFIKDGTVDTWSIMHNNVGMGEPYGIVAHQNAQRTLDAVFDGKAPGRAVTSARRPRDRAPATGTRRPAR